jgi:hypothetical protein
MVVTITLQPHQEQAIQAAIDAGLIHSADELIDSAIALLPKPSQPGKPASEAKDLVELFAPVRGLLTDEEIDRLFSRNPSTGRPISLG